MSVLQLSNGQYKDFTTLQVAYEMQHGKDDVSSRIASASITAGLFDYSAKQQRAMIYAPNSLWIILIKEYGL